MNVKKFNEYNSDNDTTNEYEKEGGKENYMFFNNLETMRRILEELSLMEESEVDDLLTKHDWASDHISVATENLEQVYNFLAAKDRDID